MKRPPADGDVHRRFAPTALMFGNIVTGCSVLAPTSMLAELSSGLDVSIRTAGLLVTFGAIVLCIGAPVSAWLTSRIERRTLLTMTLAVLALTNIASTFAPDYASLLVIRLIMLGVGVIYTPQAAGTASLLLATGYVAAAFIALALMTVFVTRPRQP
jgi:MFS transporter, DHA1 family, inner membrane transport protein